MVIEKLRRDYSISILLYIVVELTLVLLFTLSSTLYQDILSESIILLIVGSIGFSYYTIKHIKSRYQAIMCKKFKVISLEHKLDYPSYFKKKTLFSLLTLNRAYLTKNKLIPVRFISFIEGKVCYPIKELNEIELNNHYQILHIHHGHAALIQDMNNKKYVIHLQNLEPIE